MRKLLSALILASLVSLHVMVPAGAEQVVRTTQIFDLADGFVVVGSECGQFEFASIRGTVAYTSMTVDGALISSSSRLNAIGEGTDGTRYVLSAHAHTLDVPREDADRWSHSYLVNLVSPETGQVVRYKFTALFVVHEGQVVLERIESVTVC